MVKKLLSWLFMAVAMLFGSTVAYGKTVLTHTTTCKEADIDFFALPTALYIMQGGSKTARGVNQQSASISIFTYGNAATQPSKIV